MMTKDWKSLREARALVIGHDPALQKSDTQAGFALFANYCFKPEPSSRSERRKYGLAKSTFDQISFLTNDSIKPEEIYITNLCNDKLPHAPVKKTVFIPKSKAEEGIKHIKEILLSNPSIKYIFPMSLQVNYWLQKLGFYQGSQEFVDSSEPSKAGMNSNPPYYTPCKGRTFLMICGNCYRVSAGNQVVFPILHSKNFPLKGRLIAYSDSYEKIKEYFIR